MDVFEGSIGGGFGYGGIWGRMCLRLCGGCGVSYLDFVCYCGLDVFNVWCGGFCVVL